MKFENLIQQIEKTHGFLQKKSLTALNINLTLRNWLIGFYIVEFEQQGSQRAKYGKNLLKMMAQKLKHIRGLSYRNLNIFRTFYLTYPQIAQLFTQENNLPIIYELKSSNLFSLTTKNSKGQFATALFKNKEISIMQSVTAQFKNAKNSKGQTLSALFKNTENPISQSLTAKFKNDDNNINIPVEKLISNLSFTHLVEIIRMKDPLMRNFYEIEAMKGNWSVRELKRQINTLLFERTALSRNKDKAIRLANQNAETQSIENMIREPYFFEFLGLKDKDVLTESDLEQGLLDNLQAFILELGEGFCFEGRQKRITIGNKYYRIDLVFYHRILKCHVLIELKIGEVDYAAITQLNTYVSYYRKEIMQKNDTPTIGILLCSNKDEAFVEYALAGLDEKIFISKYLLYIPTKDKLKDFIKQEINKY